MHTFYSLFLTGVAIGRGT